MVGSDCCLVEDGGDQRVSRTGALLQRQGVKDVVVEEGLRRGNPVAVGDVNFSLFFVPQEPQRLCCALGGLCGGHGARGGRNFFGEAQSFRRRCARLEAGLGSMMRTKPGGGQDEMLVSQEPWDARCARFSGGLVGGTEELKGGGTWSPACRGWLVLRPLCSGLRTWRAAAWRARTARGL